MAEQKRKDLNFQTNVPAVVEFLFDKPKEGKYKNPIDPEKPTWHLYAVKKDNEEYGFFATDFLHDLIQWAGIRKNAVATITKKERPDGKSKFWTIAVNGVEYSTDDMRKNEKSDTGKKPPHVAPSSIAPSIDDMAETIILCYEKIKAKAEGRKLGLDNETLQKLATSLFIAADRKGEYIAAGVAREQTHTEELDDLPADMQDDVPPPDDSDELPF